MSGVDVSQARQEARALREAADRRLGMEAGYLKRKADLIDALRTALDAAEQRAVEAERQAMEADAQLSLMILDKEQAQTNVSDEHEARITAEQRAATARAAGMEEAARWHDEQATELRKKARMRALGQRGIWIVSRIAHCRAEAEKHEQYAAAIRAAIHKEGQSDAG